MSPIKYATRDNGVAVDPFSREISGKLVRVARIMMSNKRYALSNPCGGYLYPVALERIIFFREMEKGQSNGERRESL